MSVVAAVVVAVVLVVVGVVEVAARAVTAEADFEDAGRPEKRCLYLMWKGSMSYINGSNFRRTNFCDFREYLTNPRKQIPKKVFCQFGKMNPANFFTIHVFII